MPIDVRLLPPVMRALVEALGFEATLKLLKLRGGQRMHVPLSASRWLASVVGADGARRLCERFGGQELDLPKHDKVAQRLRDEVIRAERAQHSLNQLAAKHGLTRRHVQNIVRVDDRDDGDLFGLS